MKRFFITCLAVFAFGCSKDDGPKHLYMVKCILGNASQTTFTIDIKNFITDTRSVALNNPPLNLYDTFVYTYWSNYPSYTTISSSRIVGLCAIIVTVVEDGNVIVYDSLVKNFEKPDTAYFKEYFKTNKDR